MSLSLCSFWTELSSLCLWGWPVCIALLGSREKTLLSLKTKKAVQNKYTWAFIAAGFSVQKSGARSPCSSSICPGASWIECADQSCTSYIHSVAALASSYFIKNLLLLKLIILQLWFSKLHSWQNKATANSLNASITCGICAAQLYILQTETVINVPTPREVQVSLVEWVMVNGKCCLIPIS